MRTWIFLCVPWCVGVLNTDCTDYTDSFYGDVDIPWSSVMRKGSEHGLHGLLLWGTWIFLGVPWCVEGSELGLCGF